MAAGVATVALGVLGGESGKDGKGGSRFPPGKIEVAVLNGTAVAGSPGVPGLAEAVAREVKSDGFNVGEIGDAGSSVDTLAAYNKPEDKGAAQQVKEELSKQLENIKLGEMSGDIRGQVGSANVAVIIGRTTPTPPSCRWTSCSRPEPTPGWRPSSASRSCFRSTCRSRATFAVCASGPSATPTRSRRRSERRSRAHARPAGGGRPRDGRGRCTRGGQGRGRVGAHAGRARVGGPPGFGAVTGERAAIERESAWRRWVSRGPNARQLVWIVAGVFALGLVVAFVSLQIAGGDDAGSAPEPTVEEGGVVKRDVEVAVLNGTAVAGLAAKVGDDVSTNGYELGR